jgi:hypothetical protein
MSLTVLDEALAKISKKEKITDPLKLDEILNYFPKNREASDWEKLEKRYDLSFLESMALKSKICEYKQVTSGESYTGMHLNCTKFL